MTAAALANPAGVILPPLSVVIPTFNGSRYLNAALDSVAAAARAADIECIVVDDGSTDNTRDIVASYRDVMRIRLTEGSGAGNWVESTNAGVQLASAEYVTMLHQDDVWMPGRLAVLASLLHRKGDAALYLHGGQFLSGEGRHLGNWTPPLPGTAGHLDGQAFVERLLVQNFVCIAAPVFRRSQYLAVGGMRPELWYTADWDLWLRLAALGPVAYDTRPFVGFRVHAGSQTATRSIDLAGFRRQMEDVFELHLAKWAGADGKRARPVRRAGQATIEVNVALAAISHRLVPPLRPLAKALAGLGPGGARRMVRDARLFQRVAPRVRTLRTAPGRRRIRSPMCD